MNKASTLISQGENCSLREKKKCDCHRDTKKRGKWYPEVVMVKSFREKVTLNYVK